MKKFLIYQIKPQKTYDYLSVFFTPLSVKNKKSKKKLDVFKIFRIFACLKVKQQQNINDKNTNKTMKMKFLKIFVILAVASVLAGCTNLSNMVNRHATDAQYVQTPDPMEAHGEVVKINIAGSFQPNFFHRNAGMLFQPELQYEGGSLLLRPITLRGENATDVQGTMIPRRGGNFTYTDEVPFKPELREARLIVNPTVFPARRARGNVPTANEDALALRNARTTSEKVISTGVNTTPMLVNFQEAKPSLGKDAYRAPDNIFQTSNLFFAKDLWNLNLNYPTNRTEAARQAVEEMRAALGGELEIASINIIAWASPEGEEARNFNLSRERARVGERFLRDAYRRVIDQQVAEHNRNLPRGARRITARDLTQELPITVEHRGEDWDGFIAALRASNLRERDQILRVIQSNTDRTRREQEMRNMIVIYPELEEVILPPLRRAEMTIELVVVAKTNEEMAELAISNPSELTVEELLFAATLTEDRAVRMRIFNTAKELHPQDWRGFNNVAMLQIEDKNYNDAAANLARANTLSPNNGDVLNNLGAVALNTEKVEEAKQHFTNARGRGNAEAGANLALIFIKEGDYNGAIAAFGAQPGNLNLALAQILAGNLPAARQTLATAPTSPKTFYLRAILAAREDNANEVFSNLRQTNADFKRQAQTDAEFRKFANQTEFLNAVR
jgi:Flp pilus assembly protein TadD